MLASPVPVVVDFWAPWCKPCDAIAPHLESLAAEWGERARLVRVNVDEEPGISSRYGVLSLPTVILFAGGEPKATVYGAQSRARFEREFSSTPVTAIATSWADLLEGEEIAYSGVEPSREPTLEPLPDDLDPRVASSLVATGVTALFRHQAEAWEAAQRGENVVVTTGTASGKSLAFNLPVLDAIARDPKTRALYLYPTKALAQDQARSLAELRLKGLRPAIYDGDTPTERRWQIRKWSNVVLTNPDMLHVGVLPHHDRWGDVLANLRYVVVDEAHVYRGVFGSHVANVLRRLRRLARIYDAEPQFLLASATIANAGELALELTGEAATVVDTDTSARAEREVVIWNPPLLDAELGLRASPLGDAARLLSQLTSRGLRTICFAKSRKAAELIHRFAAERVDTATAARLAPYRAGYTAEQRREIERRLVEGELLGVTATDALELGIDIGLLDCAISVGFPGTVASLRQQWGRAGRRERGLAILVASDDALDQFFAREPDALLSRRVEAAILDHANPRILDPHVLAAAYEAPIDRRTPRRSAARPSVARRRCPSSSTRRPGTSGRAATTPPPASRCARATRRRSPSSRARPDRSSVSSSATARTRPCTRAPSTSISASSTSSRRCRSRTASRSSAPRASTGTRR